MFGVRSRAASWTLTFVPGPQVVPVQTFGAPLQWALVVQVVLHAPALQAYGAHGIVAGVTQAPLALQVELGVTSDAVGQEAGMQSVPAG